MISNEYPSFAYPVDVEFDASADSAPFSSDYTPEQGGGPGQIFAQTLAGVYLPSDFVGTSFGINASFNGVDFFPIYDSNAETPGPLSIACDADSYIPIDPIYTYGVRHYQFVSSAAETTTVTAVLRSVR